VTGQSPGRDRECINTPLSDIAQSRDVQASIETRKIRPVIGTVELRAEKAGELRGPRIAGKIAPKSVTPIGG